MGDRWKIDTKRGKYNVLKNEELRAEIIWLHYDMLVARHKDR